jgi:uncharacterized protein YecE (DUF72 family)
MSQARRVRIGTSGWIYRDWRGLFYPEDLPVRLWLDYYGKHFDTVEVNNSFYRLPGPEVFHAWRRQAPPGFVYAVKASRYLTHRRKLKEPEGPLENILGNARELGPKLGAILFQLPPRWRCNVGRLREFVALLPRDLTHVFEFRDPSWYNEEVRDVLAESGMSFCIHDMRGSAAPHWVTGPLAYLRFHGPTATASHGRYTKPQLRRWADTIRTFLGDGHDVASYFNNDVGGHAVTNARQLREMLGVGRPG